MQDLQEVNNLKRSIQNENTKLTQDNLELRKKMQGMLGDINKAKHSLGALGKTEVVKSYDYSPNEEKEKESEKENSIAKQDLEILEMQTASKSESLTEHAKSEQLLSEINEELKEKLEIASSTNDEQRRQLSTQDVMVIYFFPT